MKFQLVAGLLVLAVALAIPLTADLDEFDDALDKLDQDIEDNRSIAGASRELNSLREAFRACKGRRGEELRTCLRNVADKFDSFWTQAAQGFHQIFSEVASLEEGKEGALSKDKVEKLAEWFKKAKAAVDNVFAKLLGSDNDGSDNDDEDDEDNIDLQLENDLVDALCSIFSCWSTSSYRPSELDNEVATEFNSLSTLRSGSTSISTRGVSTNGRRTEDVQINQDVKEISERFQAELMDFMKEFASLARRIKNHRESRQNEDSDEETASPADEGESDLDVEEMDDVMNQDELEEDVTYWFRGWSPSFDKLVDTLGGK